MTFKFQSNDERWLSAGEHAAAVRWFLQVIIV